MMYFFTIMLLVIAITNLSSTSKFYINKDKKFSLGYKSKRAIESEINWIYSQKITSYVHLIFFTISFVYLILLKYFIGHRYLNINRINLHDISRFQFFIINNLSVIPTILFIFSFIVGSIVTENYLKRQERKIKIIN